MMTEFEDRAAPPARPLPRWADIAIVMGLTAVQIGPPLLMLWGWLVR